MNAIEQTTVRALRPRLMVAETAAFWPAVTAVGAAISRGDVGEVGLTLTLTLTLTLALALTLTLTSRTR